MNEVRKPNPLDDTIAFPVLGEADFEKAADFGTRCSFQPGETMFSAGDQPFDCFIILTGEVCIFDISSDDERVCVVQYGDGHFTGDIDLLTGRRAVVSCEAVTPVEALRIPPEKLRQLFIRQPGLGERIWRAMQRRRELLLRTSFQGLRVYGRKDDKETLSTVEMLFRNGVPHQWMDIADEHNLARLREISSAELRHPVVTYGKHLLFQAPTQVELAEHIGLRRQASAETYDVIILGAGPSGLGAAVYAASEGLRTLVVDGIGPGGQAGSSSRIENYAGFPNGLPGRELAQLSYLQALKFGAEFVAPSHVTCLEKGDGLYKVGTSEGDHARGKTVIVATGVSYRLLDVAGVDKLRGAGVYYNATNIEATLCAEGTVHVIGAGNSAGQAAMFLSQFAREVRLIVRGNDLRKSMSSYLSERVLFNERIKIGYESQVTEVEGSERIEAVHVRDGHGNVQREATSGLFIFIGAKPRTDFLPPDIARDDKGFVLTGAAVAELGTWKEDRLPCALETSWPGFFASGDCRSGTTKRVAFAIGDGALAITCVHDFLGTYS